MADVIKFPQPVDYTKQLRADSVLLTAREWMNSDSNLVDIVVHVRDPESGEFIPIISSVEALCDMLRQHGVEISPDTINQHGATNGN